MIPDSAIYNTTLLDKMQKFFSGYSVSLKDVLDIDGDGKVTRKDVMILARYLANWEGYAEKIKVNSK